jgi:SAM-dependent methyltransferase
MSSDRSKAPRPNYGIDAPQVIRNLIIVGVAGPLIWALVTFVIWAHYPSLPRWLLGLAGGGLNVGVLCILMAVWIFWESKVGKLRTRDRLLNRIDWKGDERVLDVGCGRGLMLIGAAKRLDSGSAIGIDLWQAEDLTGNNAEAVLENARLERVAQRVTVQTADMRQMPFRQNTFDVVVSRAAIHNLYKAADRAQAIREIARVLKPGGCALIDDIRHRRQYTSIFISNGCPEVRNMASRLIAVLLMLITFGSLSPATLVVRKAESPR